MVEYSRKKRFQAIVGLTMWKSKIKNLFWSTKIHFCKLLWFFRCFRSKIVTQEIFTHLIIFLKRFHFGSDSIRGKSDSNMIVFEEKAILSYFWTAWWKSKIFWILRYFGNDFCKLLWFFRCFRSKIDREQIFTYVETFLMTFDFGLDITVLSPK